MVGTHILGNPQIDVQHEVIFAQARSLQEVLADEHQSHLIQPTLTRLHELLVAHFKVEESFMDEHRQKHRAMLDLLERYRTSTSSPGEPGELEHVPGDQSGQLGDHDPRMADGINELLATLRSHELQNPSIAW